MDGVAALMSQEISTVHFHWRACSMDINSGFEPWTLNINEDGTLPQTPKHVSKNYCFTCYNLALLITCSTFIIHMNYNCSNHQNNFSSSFFFCFSSRSFFWATSQSIHLKERKINYVTIVKLSLTQIIISK